MNPAKYLENFSRSVEEARPHISSISHCTGLGIPAQGLSDASASGDLASKEKKPTTSNCEATASSAKANSIIDLNTLEGARICIEFCPPRGWLLISANKSAQEDNGSEHFFESLHSLLSSLSPLYCNSFHEAVSAKLSSSLTSRLGEEGRESTSIRNTPEELSK